MKKFLFIILVIVAIVLLWAIRAGAYTDGTVFSLGLIATALSGYLLSDYYFTGEKKSLRNNLVSAQKENQALKERADLLQTQFNTATPHAEVEQLEQRISVLDDEKTKLDGMSRAQTAEIANLKEKLDSLQKRHDKLVEDSVISDETGSTKALAMQDELIAAKNKIRDLTDENEALRDQNKFLTEELDLKSGPTDADTEGEKPSVVDAIGDKVSGTLGAIGSKIPSVKMPKFGGLGFNNSDDNDDSKNEAEADKDDDKPSIGSKVLGTLGVIGGAVAAVKLPKIGNILDPSADDEKDEEVIEVADDKKDEEVAEVADDKKDEEVAEVADDKKDEEVAEVADDKKDEEVTEVAEDKKDEEVTEVIEVAEDKKDEEITALDEEEKDEEIAEILAKEKAAAAAEAEAADAETEADEDKPSIGSKVLGAFGAIGAAATGAVAAVKMPTIGNMLNPDNDDKSADDDKKDAEVAETKADVDAETEADDDKPSIGSKVLGAFGAIGAAATGAVAAVKMPTIGNILNPDADDKKEEEVAETETSVEGSHLILAEEDEKTDAETDDSTEEDEDYGTSDNLEAVQGIEPNVSSILKASGIATWENLSMATPERLRVILESAGQHDTDPTSWPEQARLLVHQEYSELKKYKAHIAGN